MLTGDCASSGTAVRACAVGRSVNFPLRAELLGFRTTEFGEIVRLKPDLLQIAFSRNIQGHGDDMSVQQGAAVVGMNDQRASTRNASRFNAIKHGLTAKTPVLPGEDPAELQATIDVYKSDHQTRNQSEADLATLAAMAYWRCMRANRLEVNQVTGDIVRRMRAEAARETLEAEALGDRLLFDRRGPAPLYPSRDYEHKEPRTSDSGEPDDPDKPRKLVIQLEATRAGRRWLRRAPRRGAETDRFGSGLDLV